MANIVVIGTEHEIHLTDPKFSLDRLVRLIHCTKPDVLCAELSPEQLYGETTCNSKPEYPKAIIPYALGNDLEIVPIQPPTEEGMKQAERNRLGREKILSNPELRAKWECWEKVLAAAQEVSSLSLHSLQSRAYDTWMEIIWEKYQAKLFPEYWEVKELWNRHFLARILEAVEANQNKRITVTVGIKHKHWLNNKLREMSCVTLEHIEDYIDTRDNISFGIE